MSACTVFRRRLTATLAGEPGADQLVSLGWHQHLLSCQECRDLLEQEEALELLLSSLPEPELPTELAARVLARLREQQAGLDRLLDMDGVHVPEGLSMRVRQGLERHVADGALDRLLDAAEEVQVPPGLAGRVLAGLAEEREGQLRPARPWSLQASQWRAAAAAMLVLGGGIWISTRGRGSSLQPGPDDAVIAWLPALEYWDEVRQLDPIEADLALRFDHVDAALLEEES